MCLALPTLITITFELKIKVNEKIRKKICIYTENIYMKIMIKQKKNKRKFDNENEMLRFI